MPKETFLNLTEDKKQKIINIALEEFALNNYNKASLSRIVEKAEIAKGSMYQYFENKKDLYLYLIKIVSEEKLSSISSDLNTEENFFALYKRMNVISAKFDLSHPLYSSFLSNVMKEVQNKELDDISLKVKQMSDQYMEQFIVKAKERGQLRGDIDTSLISFIISRISIEMIDYISTKYGFSYIKIISEGKNDLPVSDEQIEAELDKLIDFFKFGLMPL